MFRRQTKCRQHPAPPPGNASTPGALQRTSASQPGRMKTLGQARPRGKTEGRAPPRNRRVGPGSSVAAPADSLKADGGPGRADTHSRSSPHPWASHSHPGPRTAALSQTEQPNTVFRKRILKQSQKNGNQLSVLFQGREKTSFPTGSRLWLGGEEGRPGAQAVGDTDRTRVRHSGQLWKQAFIFPEMSLLCSSWQEKAFRKMHAWGARRQPQTPSSPWHKP